MDGTFKLCPNKYSQLFNVLIYNEETHAYIPVLHALMTNQTSQSYSKLLSFVAKECEKYELKTTTILCDFEKSLRETIKEIYFSQC